MDQIEKFIRKLNKKMALRILDALENVVELRLESMDVEKMKGHKNLYRVRLGQIRIVFQKEQGSGVPVYIEYRGGVYKGL
ncbi:MAG: hypothetical protein Q8O95_00020 [bacterium]|nr:hypothetical protein [bacterium]